MAHVFGHRRGRLHRLERGREPQRGRPHRCRGQRLARHGRANGATSPSASSPTWCRRPSCARWLEGRKLDAVIHMGAISDTTATDGDLVMENNFRLSLRLLDWCTATRTPFIYASSAATYGDGAQGFDDDWSPAGAAQAAADESLRLEQASVRPGGGRALRAKKERLPPQWAGLKFFNVFGPNEYHKGAHGERACRRCSTTPRPASRCGCSSRTATASPTASSGAISSMSTTPSRSLRWLLDSDRGQRHLQCRHRQGAKLPRHDRRDVQGARHAAEHRIHRHAGCDPRSVSVFHASRGRESAPRRL